MVKRFVLKKMLYSLVNTNFIKFIVYKYKYQFLLHIQLKLPTCRNVPVFVIHVHMYSPILFLPSLLIRQAMLGKIKI